MLNHPSLAERLPNGLIAVNDDYRHRVVIIDPHTQQDRLAVRPHRLARPRPRPAQHPRRLRPAQPGRHDADPSIHWLTTDTGGGRRWQRSPSARRSRSRTANASGRTPVVFVHGLWLLPSSWDRWAELFEEAGYAPLTPGWPDDPETVERGARQPGGLRRQGRRPGRRPLRRGDRAGSSASRRSSVTRSAGCSPRSSPAAASSAATVAVNPAPFKGVLPLPLAALRSTLPVLAQPAQPRPRRHPHPRPVPLRLGQRPSPRTRRSSSTRRSTSPRPGSRSSRRRPPTSTPCDRGQGRHQEPRSRAAADLHRRGGPRGAAGDRHAAYKKQAATRL